MHATFYWEDPSNLILMPTTKVMITYLFFSKNGQKFVLNPLIEKEPPFERENSYVLLVDQKEV